MSLENLSTAPSTQNEISVKDLFLLGGKYYRFLASKWRIILSLSLLGGQPAEQHQSGEKSGRQLQGSGVE